MSAPAGAIVVGLDGSADSERALEWAVTAAAPRGAGVHLVHALPQSPRAIPYAEREAQEHRDLAEQLVAGARSRVEAAGLEVTFEVLDAGAVPAVLEAAARALMVVVGSRGHGALTGMVLGSVSQHVSRHAPCPVVVVREQADPRARRVIIGVDGSPASDKAIGFALDIASRTKAPVTAIRAWHDVTMSPAVGASSAAMAHVAERIAAEERLLEGALTGWTEKHPEVAITREAIPVHPARVLADASEHAALVVVGSRGRGEFSGLLLGSVSQSVLHHARCPVAVVR